MDRLTPADAAALALIPPMLDLVEFGTWINDAVPTLFVGWPAGQPSAEVRGVFNAFRTAAADEQNYFDGAGSLDAATASFQAAVDQYRALVGD